MISDVRGSPFGGVSFCSLAILRARGLGDRGKCLKTLQLNRYQASVFYFRCCPGRYSNRCLVIAVREDRLHARTVLPTPEGCGRRSSIPWSERLPPAGTVPPFGAALLHSPHEYPCHPSSPF